MLFPQKQKEDLGENLLLPTEKGNRVRKRERKEEKRERREKEPQLLFDTK